MFVDRCFAYVFGIIALLHIGPVIYLVLYYNDFDYSAVIIPLVFTAMSPVLIFVCTRMYYYVVDIEWMLILGQ